MKVLYEDENFRIVLTVEGGIRIHNKKSKDPRNPGLLRIFPENGKLYAVAEPDPTMVQMAVFHGMPAIVVE